MEQQQQDETNKWISYYREHKEIDLKEEYYFLTAVLTNYKTRPITNHNAKTHLAVREQIIVRINVVFDLIQEETFNKYNKVSL